MSITKNFELLPEFEKSKSKSTAKTITVTFSHNERIAILLVES